MGTAENPSWLFDCPLMEEIPAEGGDFVGAGGGFFWPPQAFNGASNARFVELEMFSCSACLCCLLFLISE